MSRGSSPLARGKSQCVDLDQQGLGFIPTRAGKILPAQENRWRRTVHPHSRGENITNHAADPRVFGSSPLARGKWWREGRCILAIRFIPTRAGKIEVVEHHCCRGWVHPHSRGENPISGSMGSITKGSSPLARGKCCRGCTRVAGTGFIPTRAGKIRVARAAMSRPAVHPHSRGENHNGVTSAMIQTGSSPLARGKLRASGGTWRSGGFIPTRAGKIFCFRFFAPKTAVHPHSRGENRREFSWQKFLQGSSPLARGKCRPRPRSRREPRFIPTRAGKISRDVNRRKKSGVHPHSRGENQTGNVTGAHLHGSSPLARGK